MAKRALSEEELKKVLRDYINDKAEGKLSLAADKLCTTKGHLSEILSGKRNIGEEIGSRLGFKQAEQKIRVKYWLEY